MRLGSLGGTSVPPERERCEQRPEVLLRGAGHRDQLERLSIRLRRGQASHEDLGDLASRDGAVARALAPYDDFVRRSRSAVAVDRVDASALLWRLHLVGHDVGGR